MKFTCQSDFNISADVWILFAQGDSLSPFIAHRDCDVASLVKTMVDKTESFTGKYGQTLETTVKPKDHLRRIIVVGTGTPLDALKIRELGGMVQHSLVTGGDVTVAVDSLGCDSMTEAFVQGLRLKQYDFNKYKSEQDTHIITDVFITAFDVDETTTRLMAFDAVADGVDFTRDLTSEPANILYPETFAEQMKSLESFGVTVEVFGEEALTELGMNAMLGVGQGSIRESKMVYMRYDGGNPDDAPLLLVGKGVCFDTGGISIKPSAGMEEMKWDMGGAGIVAGTMKALAGRKAKANVHAVLGLAENMPDGNAQRPGDVVTTLSGKTVEVVNTDAEGRLVLADVMTYAQRRCNPQYMIDLATLTGAILVGLGHEMAGIFSNDDNFAQTLYTSGQATGDKVWQLPCTAEYDSHIKSAIADMKNVGKGRTAGSISAAKFLEQYVEEGVKWIHIDVAAMVWENAGKPLSPKGATGYGVRLLDHLVGNHFEN